MEYDHAPPSPDELQALTEDVGYEIAMAWYMARIAVPGSTGPRQDAFKESLLIHTRCLMEFFNCRHNLDDVVATHYVPDWDPATDGGPELAWLNDHLVLVINKRLAHLTAYRQRIPKESYFIETVQGHVQTLIERFIAKAPNDVVLRVRGLKR